jgi:hypothetical protein
VWKLYSFQSYKFPPHTALAVQQLPWRLDKLHSLELISLILKYVSMFPWFLPGVTEHFRTCWFISSHLWITQSCSHYWLPPVAGEQSSCHFNLLYSPRLLWWPGTGLSCRASICPTPHSDCLCSGFTACPGFSFLPSAQLGCSFSIIECRY